MANPVLIQKQIKDNTEDLQNFVKDLKLWEEEMKRKDRQLSNEQSEEVLPPVRKPRYSEASKKIERKNENNEKKRIKSYDYKAWENFDVDKACEEVDNEVSEKPEDDEEISTQEDDKYLIEKALYEKELGNQFVKKEKWDDAIDCYTKAIAAYDRDPVFFANRGLCYLKKKQYSRVEQDCTQSLKLDATYVKAYMRRAAAREALNFIEDARSDLTKVLQLEPNNVQAQRDLTRVKSATASVKEIKKKEKVEDKLNKPPLPKVSSDKASATKLAKSLPSTSSLSNDESNLKSEKPLNDSLGPKWDPCVSTVEPIEKPPHLRSKKTLKRIEIYDVGLNAPEHVCTRKLPQSKDVLISSDKEKLHIATSAKLTPRSCNTLPSTHNVVNTVPPPPPKTSVQFYLSWSTVKHDAQLCYQFLKQIRGEQLPEIFKDSLESKMFSSILQVLASEFTAADEAVLPYLRGLSGVRRFSTLALFMSSQDKSYILRLLDYCLDRKDCTPQEITQIKRIYEMA